MTREELLSHPQAGRTLDEAAALLGVKREVLTHWCRVHKVDWRRERNKNPEVKATCRAVLNAAQRLSSRNSHA